jgi:hypothetical protein
MDGGIRSHVYLEIMQQKKMFPLFVTSQTQRGTVLQGYHRNVYKHIHQNQIQQSSKLNSC